MPKLNATDLPNSRAGRFYAEASAALHQVRSTLSDLLDSLPGSVKRPVELQKALHLNQKLSWLILSTINADHTLDATPFVPTQSAMRTFLDSARRHKLPPHLVQAVSEAIQQFEELVERHAGDRTAFEAMVSVQSSESRRRFFQEQQRAAFRANSLILGMQAETQFSTFICAPADDRVRLNIVSLIGRIGFWQTRPDVSCLIGVNRASEADRASPVPLAFEPLDPSGAEGDSAGLIREFCSQPLPKIRVERTASNCVRTELLGDAVGNTAAVNCIVGNIIRNVGSRYRRNNDPSIYYSYHVRVPSKVLIFDLLLHQDLFGPVTPDVTVFSEHEGGVPVSEGGKKIELPVQESVSYLGKGPDTLHTRDIPRYSELCRRAFERMAWESGHFDTYRCRIEYPIMPTTIAITHDLPSPP